jgi:hypothetical protein
MELVLRVLEQLHRLPCVEPTIEVSLQSSTYPCFLIIPEFLIAFCTNQNLPSNTSSWSNVCGNHLNKSRPTQRLISSSKGAWQHAPVTQGFNFCQNCKAAFTDMKEYHRLSIKKKNISRYCFHFLHSRGWWLAGHEIEMVQGQRKPPTRSRKPNTPN